MEIEPNTSIVREFSQTSGGIIFIPRGNWSLGTCCVVGLVEKYVWILLPLGELLAAGLISGLGCPKSYRTKSIYIHVCVWIKKSSWMAYIYIQLNRILKPSRFFF